MKYNLYMPKAIWNRNNPERLLYTPRFKVGDCIAWYDTDGKLRDGFIAYVAMADTVVPRHYLRQPGSHFKSRKATFGRYIIDCGTRTVEFPNGQKSQVIEYRAVSFGNDTAKLFDPFDSI